MLISIEFVNKHDFFKSYGFLAKFFYFYMHMNGIDVYLTWLVSWCENETWYVYFVSQVVNESFCFHSN